MAAVTAAISLERLALAGPLIVRITGAAAIATGVPLLAPAAGFAGKRLDELRPSSP